MLSIYVYNRWKYLKMRDMVCFIDDKLWYILYDK